LLARMAVSTPACETGTSLVQPPTRASASNVQASEPRASARRPSPSPGTRVPPLGCPASPASGLLHYQPGPRPGRAPSTAPPGPAEADLDQGPRLHHRGLRAPTHQHRLASRCERVQPIVASDCKRQVLGSQGRFQRAHPVVCRGAPAAAGPLSASRSCPS
jgi:hypothetical protein